ncbi:MAG: protein arginine kinase [Deltaproteobacteria bacterium]
MMKESTEKSKVKSGIVVSSRVRLARNCADYPFYAKLGLDEAVKVVDTFKSAVSKSKDNLSKKLFFVDSTKMPALEKACLVEKHLVSRDFAFKREVTGLVLSEDESISLMINEEDHLRIQSILEGLQISKCWENCNLVDNIIEGNVKYAYSDQLGYLTSCPTNVGTGMRVSIMVHLPALTILGYLRNVIDTVNKLGITVRGLYGEGSDFMGNLYQFSNQISLGQPEEEIITKMEIIAQRIIEQEEFARQKLLETRIQLEDRLFRSYGIFSNARILSSNECMKLLSDVRLGIELGIIKNIDMEVINDLMVVTQPANLQKHYQSILTSIERDIKRAELIREKLGGVLNV